jgi:molybdopterin molybdotransferase
MHQTSDTVLGFAQPTLVADAIAWIDRAAAGHLRSERLPLDQAFGRVLASEVRAGSDAPPFDRAVADGYAVDAETTIGASVYNPLAFRIGGSGPSILPSATAVACGSPLPAGANAVVPLDYAQADAAGEILELIDPVPAGANIERAANQYARGTLLLGSGRRLGPAELGLIAEGGIGAVDVIRRPRVRVIVTAPDLAGAAGELPRGAVFDADTPMLRGLVERDGGTIEPCAVDRNCATAIRNAVAAPGADLVIVVGGSGPGPNDQRVLQALGRAAEGDGDGDGLAIHGIALRPGSSSGVGRIRGRPLFLLPGLPPACLWAYEMLAGRAVRRLAGQDPELPYADRDFVTAGKIVSSIGFLEVWPVRLVAPDRVEVVSAAAPDGSFGLFATIAQADGFVLVPEASEGFPPETRVRVYLYNDRKPGLGLGASEV